MNRFKIEIDKNYLVTSLKTLVFIKYNHEIPVLYRQEYTSLCNKMLRAYYFKECKLDNRTTMDHVKLELLQDVPVSTLGRLNEYLN